MFRWANIALVAVSISAEDAPAPDAGACASITISNGCKDTYMGSIEGVYRPVAGSSCAGRPAYANGDGSRTMIYDGEREYWRLGVLCNEGSCRCLPPSYATFNLDDAEVDCFDGREGYGSKASNSYEYTPLEVTCDDGSAGGGGSPGSSPVPASPAPPTPTNYSPSGGEGGGSPGSSLVSATPVTDKDQFCRDLRNLEAHMNKGFEDFTGNTVASSFRCSCETEPLVSEEFHIDCVLEYSDRGDRYTNFERMTFRYSDSHGGYQIVESWWGDSSIGGSVEADAPQEVYYFEDGALDSCEVDSCGCDVCDDGRSVVIDCGGTPARCGDGYAGSLSNTFDFGTIARSTGDGAAGADSADAETSASAETSEATLSTGAGTTTSTIGGTPGGSSASGGIATATTNDTPQDISASADTSEVTPSTGAGTTPTLGGTPGGSSASGGVTTATTNDAPQDISDLLLDENCAIMTSSAALSFLALVILANHCCFVY